MAYPGERENKEYMDYVEETTSAGGTPLPKEEWRKQRTASAETEFTAGFQGARKGQ